MKIAFVLAACALAACALTPASAQQETCNYIVENGDSLWQIADNYGLNETVLIGLNPNIADPETIFIGDVIKVPCQGDPENGNSITNLLSHRQDLSILQAAIAAAGLGEDFSNGNLDVTLFAPTNDAFGALLAELKLTPEALLNDTALLTSVLTYHVLPGGVFAAEDFVTKTYNTMNDEKVRIRVADDGTVGIRTVAGQTARVTEADLEAGSSVVHVINEVLLPFPQEATPAPTAAPTTPAAPRPTAGGPCVYIVKEGDILFDIAASVNSTVAQLQELNPTVEDPELILPGQEIKTC